MPRASLNSMLECFIAQKEFINGIYMEQIKVNVSVHIRCCSGSLWYPGFVEFVAESQFRKPPTRLYMSLGDKESGVKNQAMN